MSNIPIKEELVLCPMCKKPLAKRDGNTLTYLRRQKGETDKVKMEIAHYSGNGHYKISCECGGGCIFASIHEGMTLSDSVAVNKKPA